jgi:hypothetical protein
MRPFQVEDLKEVGSFGKVNMGDGGQDSSVSIATGYGLDGPGIESLWGEIFRTLPDRPWAHPASRTMGTGHFPGVMRPGRSADHPPPSSAEVTTPPLGLRGLL